MSKQDVKENLLEWYENLDPASVQVRQNPDDDREEQPEEKPEESPEKAVDKIEKSADLHKASVLTRALDNKLSLLSGVFDGYENEDKKDKIKKEIKEIIKRIEKIITEGFDGVSDNAK